MRFRRGRAPRADWPPPRAPPAGPPRRPTIRRRPRRALRPEGRPGTHLGATVLSRPGQQPSQSRSRPDYGRMSRQRAICIANEHRDSQVISAAQTRARRRLRNFVWTACSGATGSRSLTSRCEMEGGRGAESPAVRRPSFAHAKRGDVELGSYYRSSLQERRGGF